MSQITAEKEQQHSAPSSVGPQANKGMQGAAPPPFSLSASPVQMSPEGEKKEEAAACDPTKVPVIDTKAAIAYNNGLEFRLDWVRNLQQALVNKMTIKDGNFDEELVKAVAKFQHCHPKLSKGVDGKIGKNTRRELEATHAVLKNSIIGTELDARVLVPAGASDAQKYAYYKGMIEGTGAVFLSGAKEMNLLGIRGVKIADGTDAHKVKGATLAKGTLYQTESAKDFAAARKAGKADDHMKWNKTEGHDDMIISLWVDDKGAMHVKERQGSVDAASNWNKDVYGTGHLRDGQYAFKKGRHGTPSSTHKKAVNTLSKEDKKKINVKGGSNGTNMSYDALRPARNQEVWRNYAKGRKNQKNDRYIDAEEEATSNEQIYGDHHRYQNDNFAINIHTSGADYGNSVACQNVPVDQYVSFMEEINASSNTKNILYTLIDASKISAGLKLVKHEDRSEETGGQSEGQQQGGMPGGMNWMPPMMWPFFPMAGMLPFMYHPFM